MHNQHLILERVVKHDIADDWFVGMTLLWTIAGNVMHDATDPNFAFRPQIFAYQDRPLD